MGSLALCPIFLTSTQKTADVMLQAAAAILDCKALLNNVHKN